MKRRKLPVQITHINNIGIDNGHFAYSGAADLLRSICTYAPKPYYQNMDCC